MPFFSDIVIKSNTLQTQQIFVLFPTTATGDEPRNWITLFLPSLCLKLNFSGVLFDSFFFPLPTEVIYLSANQSSWSTEAFVL